MSITLFILILCCLFFMFLNSSSHKIKYETSNVIAVGNKNIVVANSNIIHGQNLFTCNNISALSNFNFKEIKEGSLLVVKNEKYVPAEKVKVSSEGVLTCSKLQIQDTIFERPSKEGIVTILDGCTETTNQTCLNKTFFKKLQPSNKLLTYSATNDIFSTFLSLTDSTKNLSVFNVKQEKWIEVIEKTQSEKNSLYIFNSNNRLLKLDPNISPGSLLYLDQNTNTLTNVKENVNKTFQGFKPGYMFNSHFTIPSLPTHNKTCLLVNIYTELYFATKCKFGNNNDIPDSIDKFVVFDKDGSLTPLNMMLSSSLTKCTTCSVLITDKNGILTPKMSLLDTQSLLFDKMDIKLKHLHFVILRDTGEVDFSSVVLNLSNQQQNSQLLTYNSKTHSINFVSTPLSISRENTFIPVTTTSNQLFVGTKYNESGIIINKLKVQHVEFDFTNIKSNSVLCFKKNKCVFVPLNIPLFHNKKANNSYINPLKTTNKIHVPFPCTQQKEVSVHYLESEFGSQWTNVMKFDSLDISTCLQVDCNVANNETSMFQLRSLNTVSTITTVSAYPKSLYLFMREKSDVFLFAKSVLGNIVKINPIQFKVL